jgi:CDP-diacylglycerol--serine O-phosphatidyltransferase
MVWAMNEYQIRGADVKWLAWILTMFAGLTMVSNLKYYSGKDINPRKSVSFPVVVAIALAVVALVAVSSTLPEMLFLLFLCYALSGYAIAAWDMLRRKGGGGPPPAAPLP